MSSWDDATPDEIRDARIQELEDKIQNLVEVLIEAFENGTVPRVHEEGDTTMAQILKEEWGK